MRAVTRLAVGAGFIRQTGASHSPIVETASMSASMANIRWQIPHSRTRFTVYCTVYALSASPGPTLAAETEMHGLQLQQQPRIKVWRDRSSSFIALQSGHCQLHLLGL